MLSQDSRERVLFIVRSTPEGTEPFRPGETSVPASGKVVGNREAELKVETVLDGWLTAGRFNDAFEKALSAFLGAKHVLTANSGSSANLLAMSTLTSPELAERAVKPGDEVITVAAAYSTTIAPILQAGAVPVFVDTTGEGGTASTNDPRLANLLRSFRDWGRHCNCRPGQDDICGHHFDDQYGDLPQGYDHKYAYSHAEFNMKMTDKQAACGLANSDAVMERGFCLGVWPGLTRDMLEYAANTLLGCAG